MNRWFRETAESLRYLAEESAVLEASELVAECLDERSVSRSALADRLGVGRSEITQRLSGKRNLSVKSLAAMLHELGYRLSLGVEDLAPVHHPAPQHIVVSAARALPQPRYTSTGNPLRLVKNAA